MLKNNTIYSSKNSLLIFIKRKIKGLKINRTINLKGKEKLLTSSVFFVVALTSISLMYRTLSGEGGRNTFSHLKPSIPTLANKKAVSTATFATPDSKSNQSLVKAEWKAEWKAVETLLASNDKRREKLFKKLKLDKGEYIIVGVLVSCGDCDAIALELNKKANLGQIIAITNASLKDANDWKTRLGLKFRVESVSNELFDDSGIVIVPTLIRVKDFKAIGVSEETKVID